MSATAPNIYQRINNVRAANEYIKKSKEIDVGGKYMVVTHDDVTNKLREDLVKNGVVIVPSLDGTPTVKQDTGMVMGAKAIPMIRFEAVYAVEFVNVDNPADKLVMRVAAHAIDSGDKAPGKAISYATKYAMLKVFSIVTGENEEERKEEGAGAGGGMPASEAANWRAKIDELTLTDDPNLLWKNQILPACKKYPDKASATQLRAYLTAKVSKLKGGKGAVTAH